MHPSHTSFKLLFIAIYLSAGIIHLKAQTLEWRYVFDYPVNTRCGDLLVDEDQHVFANISTQRPDESYRGGGMIALDANGRFNGMMMMNDPDAEATFAPFGQGRYISQYGGSSIFDAQGNLIASGQGFGGNHFARVTTTNGHVYFSKPLDGFKASYITIGKVSNDFQIDKDSIPLQSIAIEGLGISLPYKKPAMTSHGIWVVPFHYGRRVYSTMSVDHAFVCAIKDKKILWKFPQSLSDYNGVAVTAEGERIGVVLIGSSMSNQFYLLDKNGQVQTQFDFQITGTVKDVRMKQEHVTILTTNSLYVFTMDGVRVSHISITKDFLINPTAFEVIDSGHYIIAGNYEGQATIIRISMSEPGSPSILGDQVDLPLGEEFPDNTQATTPVSQVTLQTMSAETISASIFPNPASLYINFELKNKPALPCTIAVFDGSGQQLHNDTFEGNNYTLPLDRFVPGTYFYRLQFSSSQEKILSGKFVKT